MQVTWENKLKKFFSVCNKPLDWINFGSEARLTVIVKTCEFLHEAEKLDKDNKVLESEIYTSKTVKEVFSVIPNDVAMLIVKNGSGAKAPVKTKLAEIKTYLEKEFEVAHETNMYSEAFKASHKNLNTALHDGVNAVDTNRDEQEGRKKEDGHDCSKTDACKTDWGTLGCIVVYELATVKERLQYFRTNKRCFKCGKALRFHQNQPGTGPPICKPNGLANSSPARCKFSNCRLGAALCSKHARMIQTMPSRSYLTGSEVTTS